MAEIFNEQRKLGIRIVADGATMHNGLPVIGLREADDEVLFIDNQRVLGVDVLDADQAIYNEQPVRGAVMIDDGRTMYNGERVTPSKGGALNPIIILGPKLLAWWDARYGTTLSGSQITAWMDRKNGYTLTQGVSASRPILLPTGFGGFPGVQTDGADDFLSMASQPFPSGSAPCRIYSVLQNEDAIGVTALKVPFFYGLAQATGRRIARTVVDGIVAMTGSVGTGAVTPGVPRPFVNCETGRHRTRLDIGASASTAYTDGVAGTAGAIVPGTSATGSVVFGAMPGGASLFKGITSDILVTDGTETADELAKIEAWQIARMM